MEIDIEHIWTHLTSGHPPATVQSENPLDTGLVWFKKGPNSKWDKWATNSAVYWRTDLELISLYLMVTKYAYVHFATVTIALVGKGSPNPLGNYVGRAKDVGHGSLIKRRTAARRRGEDESTNPMDSCGFEMNGWFSQKFPLVEMDPNGCFQKIGVYTPKWMV